MNNWSLRKLLGVGLLGVLVCALLSVYKGQDTNWDLLNYHRYVAYAFLHDRLSVDLAAAGMQSYFNPSLDVPVYWLSEHLPGWWVGAVLGAWHGLIFVLVLLIAREVWPKGQGGQPLLVVCAGVLAPVFWGGLGNSMGDNAVAVMALSAVWSAIRCVKLVVAGGSFWVWGGLTGVLLGACTALKLTNASVAVALGLSMLLSVRQPLVCLKLIACMLPGGVLGFALGGGWWFWQVWQQFGNPFFPQFGNVFPSPLAESVALVDKRFVPDNLGGLILRPLLMPLNYRITSEFFVLPLLWPCWFVGGVLFLAQPVMRRFRPVMPATPVVRWRAEQQLLVCFVLLAVVLWALLFGIYRYTAAMEPLLPLCTLLLLDKAGCLTRALPWLNRVLVISMVCTVAGGSVNWGHAAWAERSYRLDAGDVVEGAKPLVLLAGVGNSWLIPFLPERARFASVGSGFNFGRHYDAEVRKRAQESDRVYALVGMSQNWRFDVIDKSNQVLDTLRLRDSEQACAWLEDLIKRTKPHAGLARCEGAACAHRCQLTKLDSDRAEVQRRDNEALDGARAMMGTYGLAVDEARCVVAGAYLGQKRYPFRVCELRRVAP
jgi:hypothetical protein